MGRFVLQRTIQDEYHFVLKSASGLLVLKSRWYANKALCEAALEEFREIALHEQLYLKYMNARMWHSFSILSLQGEELAYSVPFASDAVMEVMITMVKEVVVDAPVAMQ